MPHTSQTPRRLVVIGGSNMDLSGRPTAALVLGESNIGQIQASPGGVARNIAEALARLGHAVSLISALGQDAMSEALSHETSQAGVDLSPCLRLPGRACSTYLTLLDHHGELLAAINDMSALAALDPEALEARGAVLDAADAWVIDANLEPESLNYLFQRASTTRPIFAEPVSAIKASRLRAHLDRLSLLKPNRAEAAALTDLPADAPAQDLAHALHNQGLPRLVLSLGRDGLYASAIGSDPILLPAAATQVRSVTGAGDTLMAGLIDAWLAGRTLAESLAWARAAALLSLQSNRAVSTELSPAAVSSLLKGFA